MRQTYSVFYALIAGCFLLWGCASTQSSGNAKRGYNFSSIDKVAVVAIEGALGSEADKQQLTDMMNQQLLGRGYSPIERQQMLAVLQERDFQGTSITEAAALGKLLNVSAVIISNIPNYGDKMSMSVKMINVDDSSILWTANGTGDIGGSATQILGGLMGAGIGGTAGAAAGGRTGGTVGVLGGGAAGAVGGGLITPQKAEQANKLITEIFGSLPPRDI